MPNESHIPSRRAFERALDDNQRAGHENRGFLSLERGFLPSENPLLALPETHHVWDDIADHLPEHFKNLTVRKVLDDMPVLPADAQHLPDRYLLRASTLISILSHAYVRSEATAHHQIPTCLLQPWEEIARRLERPVPFLSYIDLILYNWRVRTPRRCPMPFSLTISICWCRLLAMRKNAFFISRRWKFMLPLLLPFKR